MKVQFDASFYRSIQKQKDKSVFSKLRQVILDLENAQSLSEIRNVKKPQGFKNYYRIRIGDYRLGFEKIDGQTIRIVILASRKDIYKLFP